MSKTMTFKMRQFVRPQISLMPPIRRRFTSECLSEEELYVRLLRRSGETSDLSRGKSVHGNFIKGRLPFSIFMRNHILNCYMKCGDLVSARNLFDEMPDRNVVSWSAVISGFVQNGCPYEAVLTFSRMLRDGSSSPNEFTLVSVLQACSLLEGLTHSYQVFAFVVRLGFESNIFLVNAFLTALIRHEKLKEAFVLFEECPGKDIVTWNAMLAGFLQYSYENVPGFWYRMISEKESNVRPDNYTFASVLTGLAAVSDLQMGLQVHAQLIKHGHGEEICVGNALVDMYIKNQKLFDGFRAFKEMPEKDVSSWTQIAAGCLQCGEPSKTLEVILDMKQLGVKLNRFTLSTALNACASIASLEEGKKFHGLRIKLGNNEIDVCVDNALLDMYAKCGFMEAAQNVFRTMNTRSVISWTTLIMGCAQNGQTREALEAFEEMRRFGIEPNYITFICVLYACSQGGYVEEGWRYFNSMNEEHKIEPGEDHYVCMVNLLGRSGRLNEAEDLILGMPFETHTGLVWQVLLGACQVHGDVEMAERAGRRAMDLNQKDPSNYVLLSNAFAGMNNWENVGVLRELMESRNVKKVPGTSWI